MSTEFPVSTAIPLVRYEQAKAQTERAFAALTEAAPWVQSAARVAEAIRHENASVRSRLGKLTALADRIHKAVAPYAQCEAGCSACCHISVLVTAEEAAAIGRALQIPVATPLHVSSLAHQADPESLRSRYFGAPCTFLENGHCSIYAHRPVACRLHANLGDAFFCDTAVPPTESYVPNIDWNSFFLVMMLMLAQSSVADLREFFPFGRAAG